MSSPFLVPEPADYAISLTRDCDAVWTINRVDSNGNNLPWNAVVTIEFTVVGTLNWRGVSPRRTMTDDEQMIAAPD